MESFASRLNPILASTCCPTNKVVSYYFLEDTLKIVTRQPTKKLKLEGTVLHAVPSYARWIVKGKRVPSYARWSMRGKCFLQVLSSN